MMNLENYYILSIYFNILYFKNNDIIDSIILMKDGKYAVCKINEVIFNNSLHINIRLYQLN